MIEFITKFGKRWFRNFVSLLLLEYVYPGFQNLGNPALLISAALLLSLIQVFINPFLKMIFLPINIITLGMFRWLIDTVHLVIVAYMIDAIQFIAFSYTSFTFLGIPIPGGQLNLIFSVIVGTILFKFIREGIKLVT